MSAKAVQRVNRLEIVLAFLFGCLALAAVLWLAFKNESLTEPQFEILRILLALAGGGVGAMIPGFLDLNMKAGTNLALRAGGALAVFVVLYFWSPAHWGPPSAGTVIQTTGGIGSPALNGNGNTVTNNGAPARWGLTVGLLILLAGLSAPTATADVKQNTGEGSWCSPAQNGNNNQVICNGVDPRAMANLNDLLDLRNISLKQKTAEADEWVRKYNLLNDQCEDAKKELAAKGEDASLVQIAQDLLHGGKLEMARQIYDQLIASDEGNIDRAAQHYFGRATVMSLQFQAAEALTDYKKAYRYRPSNPVYADGYAEAAYKQGLYIEAEGGWTESLHIYRELTQHNSGANQTDLARTLNRLGDVYSDTGRPADAEKAYLEALTIRRGLAQRDPGYRSAYAVAIILNDLGIVYNDTDRQSDAEKVFTEALAIDLALTQQDPANYQPDLASIFNNLGVLYLNTGRQGDPETFLTNAAIIRRGLALHEPLYRSDLAVTLSNLGILDSFTGRQPDAEKAYNEALAIYRDLAQHDPGAYARDLATTLGNLGLLYSNTGRWHEAEKVHTEVLARFRELNQRQPGAYLLLIAIALNNLGNLHQKTDRLADAEKAYTEAAAIFGELAKGNPAYATQAASLNDRLSELRNQISSSERR